MQRNETGELIFSPSDLIRYLKSPFASWMDRFNVEYPNALVPDEETEDEKLVADSGNKHEQDVFDEYLLDWPGMVVLKKNEFLALDQTIQAFADKAPVIFQAYLKKGQFEGMADFIELTPEGLYQIWDTKLARSLKAYYAIQLCCYAEMLDEVMAVPQSDKFGIILGSKVRVELRREDFVHYYRQLRDSFLEMQANFTGDLEDRPEPWPRADHGRWGSYAESFFGETDDLVKVAGISIGQIKKLKAAGITTLTALASASEITVPKLSQDSMEKLVQQARLQLATRLARQTAPDALPSFETLPHLGLNGEAVGLAALPVAHPADVFFDMEGFPLVPGGLEYLFGVCVRTESPNRYEFQDWWGHDRAEEKMAFGQFVDWVFARWRANPGMHIYHYAPYEVSALKRLSTQHDTHQDEVDDLLRNDVFVDLFHIVRRGLRIGEENYSIKSVEHLYRAVKRSTEVSTSVGSIVQYDRWVQSKEPKDWKSSKILKDIRDYNEDDCVSNAELERWLRAVADENGIPTGLKAFSSEMPTLTEPSEEAGERARIAAALRDLGDPTSLTLADLVDFHRREDKPMWWKMFERSVATPEVLRNDHGCIEGIEALGEPVPEKRSLVQRYRFDPNQECKLSAGEKMMFTHQLDAKFTMVSLDVEEGILQLKIGAASINGKFGGEFPQVGSIIPDESIPAKEIQKALTEVASQQLEGDLHASVKALLERIPPASALQEDGESTTEAAVRVTRGMQGGCLVIQGPPGTGKTYTASRVIAALVAEGKRVGVASNSHKVILNLLSACGNAVKGTGAELVGIKVGGSPESEVFRDNPKLMYLEKSTEAFGKFAGGVIAGTAWLFARQEWQDGLDFLFIDEAGQVSLANAIAMARSADNLILMGDQMQLEQPIQGSHPGDAGLSVLQYALKDTVVSKPNLPVFHAVVPPTYGLFLGESRRMHPEVCTFISDSIYEGRLSSHRDCGNQAVAADGKHVNCEAGIVFVPVEHDGNVQRSDEEVERVQELYAELKGKIYTDKNGVQRPLELEDFLFVAPYNAQVRALTAALPAGARVGSVDKFQGQEAPVCILSLSSSYGEYGSRGLGFILDRNRINVAISRAQCLAVVVADPRIAHSSVGSIAEMKLLNLFCKISRTGR